MFAQVIVDVPVKQVNRPFEYRIPAIFEGKIEVGMRVVVPFAGRSVQGFVVSIRPTSDFEGELKEIERLMDLEPVLSKEMIELGEYMSNHLFAFLIHCYQTMLPAMLKTTTRKLENPQEQEEIFQRIFNEQLEIEVTDEMPKEVLSELLRLKQKGIVQTKTLVEDRKQIKTEDWIVLSYLPEEYLEMMKQVPKNAAKQLRFLEGLSSLENTEISKAEFITRFNVVQADVKKALEKGWILLEKRAVDRDPYAGRKIVHSKPFELNEEQKQVFQQVLEEESDETSHVYLLQGVTGSGKTEIYIELIKKAFFEGYGSIFLVPEISLTPQMVERFQSEFKNNIAILHSSLSDIERAKEWESIYTGEKKIVLGVRSAIFSPVKNLKYIILDEEHEATYKQDSSPRYNAKYVAIKRCLDEDAKLILGSATPSIESYYYAKTGIYELLSLEDRYGNAQMPDIQVVDMKQEDDLFFSKALLEEIKNTLLKNEQVILLLNRKGYSTYIQCKDCGYVEECENCSIKMSYYKGVNKYKCNYCGKQIHYTGKCTKCGSTNLIHSGKGIERIEEELKKYFDVPMIKVDSELSRNKDYFSKIYKDFSDKKYSILIGTQIIAKGLHFPNVTLVGVINSDIILNFPDFRSGEKTFQLLTQVSGRAGRGDKKGKVIIQTYEPENNVIKDSKEENYDLFYEKEINSRKIFSYPPFSKILNIGFSSEDEARLLEISKKFYDEIKSENIELYGPMPSMVYKVQKRFRMNIFVKGSKKKIDKFKLFLKRKLNEFNDAKVRIVVDIDPINMM